MIHTQDPFRLAVVGSPEAAAVAGRFLDHITPRICSRGQPVILSCDGCSDELTAALAEHAREVGWEMAFFTSLDLEPLLDCDAVAAMPGNRDHTTWDSIELAADLGKPVRVLTGRADPEPVPGAPTVRVISPVAVSGTTPLFPTEGFLNAGGYAEAAAGGLGDLSC